MRKLIAKLLGWKVIYAQYHDGEVICRLAHPTPYGYFAYAHSRMFDIGGFICNPDGTTTGACYVESWKDA